MSYRSGYSWRWEPRSPSWPATASSPGTCSSCGAVDRMGDPFEGLFDSGRVLERMGVELTAQARRGDLEPGGGRRAQGARAGALLPAPKQNNPPPLRKAG